MKRSLIWIVVSSGMVLWGSDFVSGQDTGFLHRLNPFRRLRERQTERFSSPEAEQGGPTELSRRGMHAPWNQNSLPSSSAAPDRQEHRWRWRRDLQTGDETDLTSQEAGLDQQHPWWAGHSADPSPLPAATDQGGPFGERTPAGNPPTVDELRAHLLARGVNPAIVDRQAERLASQRGDSQARRAKRLPDQTPQLEKIRAEMRARGIEPRHIDRQLSHTARTRGARERFQHRIGDGRLSGWGADQREPRARADRANIEPRPVRDRLTRPESRPRPDHAVARLGAGRTRRQ